MWNDFNNLKKENFAKCTELLKLELKESDMTSTLHKQFLGPPQVSNFHQFRSTVSCFQDITYFAISH